MSAVWSPSWRFSCLAGRACSKQQIVFSRPISTALSDANSAFRRGKGSGYVRLNAGATGGSSNVRSPRLHPYCRKLQVNGVTRLGVISSRWNSTSSVTEQVHGDESRFGVRRLSKSEIAVILGKQVSYEEGDSILRRVQHQRISGTLDHPLPVPELLIAKALAWLRKTYPIDEEAAIIARIDQEIEEERKKSDNHSQSVLDQIKAENELNAAKEKEAKEVANQEEKNANGPTNITTAPGAIVARRTESADWVKKYKEKATSKIITPLEMTKFERLWPSTLVVLAVVGLSALCAQNYYPPSRTARLWPDVPPVAATILTLIGVNVFIFLLWRLPQAWYFLNRQMTLIPGYPHSASLLGNVFSHQSFSHLAMNMGVLWLIGTGLHNDIGRGNFLAVFLTCGVISSYISLYFYVSRNILYTSSLGASGAICGLIATWFTLDSHRSVSFVFLPDRFIHGWSPYIILGLMVAGDLIGATRRIRGIGQGGIDHIAHLGGYAAGLGCAQVLRYQRRQREQKDDEKKENITSTMRPIRAD